MSIARNVVDGSSKWVGIVERRKLEWYDLGLAKRWKNSDGNENNVLWRKIAFK